MRRKNRSLCQKSTEIAVNIVKTSSLWVARMTLRPAERVPIRRAAETTSVAIQKTGKSKRLVDPESSPVASYLLESDTGEGVDGKAADYIKKFREKNRSDSSLIVRSEVSKCIPPPPKPMWTSYGR